MESLANKYRPKSWHDVVGQSITIKILKQQIIKDLIKNCYLFCGPTGDGKTTIARIFSKSINGDGYSPIEIDAASNNGVDNVRQLVSEAYKRDLNGKYKVIIVDECHMITTAGWNAFLKCLEETPKYTIFLFCTTDPQKIPETIKNRMQIYNITKLSMLEIKDRLRYICIQENKTVNEEVLEYLSAHSNGSMREAITNLEKCLTYSSNPDLESVISILGKCNIDILFNIVNSLIDGDEKALFSILNQLEKTNINISLVVSDFIGLILDILKYIIFNDITATTLPVIYEDNLKSVLNFDNPKNYYNYVLNKLVELQSLIRYSNNCLDLFQIKLLEIARCQ